MLDFKLVSADSHLNEPPAGSGAMSVWLPSCNAWEEPLFSRSVDLSLGFRSFGMMVPSFQSRFRPQSTSSGEPVLGSVLLTSDHFLASFFLACHLAPMA